MTGHPHAASTAKRGEIVSQGRMLGRRHRASPHYFSSSFHNERPTCSAVMCRRHNFRSYACPGCSCWAHWPPASSGRLHSRGLCLLLMALLRARLQAGCWLRQQALMWSEENQKSPPIKLMYALLPPRQRATLDTSLGFSLAIGLIRHIRPQICPRSL
jgi:hypothetical protein